MFDEEYFKSLLEQTKDILIKKEKTSDEIYRAECNVVVLKLIARKIENEEIRRKVLDDLHQIDKSCGPIVLKTTEKKKKESDEAFLEHKRRLEEELLEYSKTLKRKANTLNKKFDEDSKIIEDLQQNYERNISTVAANIKDLTVQVNSVHPLKLTFIALFIFVVMYFFIQFNSFTKILD
ncbi:hypothetical protein EDEG_00105 [Edhazardia aedis USNM 41457]|uniref:Uncharacterized protein n=1 Tax=Edhazardia aedis (strain USNM 41457) TaxID=1003232 RepID=J9DQP4_EDHAE|nr:hypothetical protein EDEG_00105 [Edhazardia aedis USNM 41457]|eukprot:EJW04885.1 hypothetical protein EDEG_00105 [Edhazardia aedis USNM 41457]